MISVELYDSDIDILKSALDEKAARLRDQARSMRHVHRVDQDLIKYAEGLAEACEKLSYRLSEARAMGEAK